jgi:hypothetical protein
LDEDVLDTNVFISAVLKLKWDQKIKSDCRSHACHRSVPALCVHA